MATLRASTLHAVPNVCRSETRLDGGVLQVALVNVRPRRIDD